MTTKEYNTIRLSSTRNRRLSIMMSLNLSSSNNLWQPFILAVKNWGHSVMNAVILKFNKSQFLMHVVSGVFYAMAGVCLFTSHSDIINIAICVLCSCGWWKKIPTTACCFFCGTPAKAENRSLIIYVIGGRKHQPWRVVFLRTPAGAENISFLLSKKKHSLGIMQFQSKTSITNIQSV